MKMRDASRLPITAGLRYLQVVPELTEAIGKLGK